MFVCVALVHKVVCVRKSVFEQCRSLILKTIFEKNAQTSVAVVFKAFPKMGRCLKALAQMLSSLGKSVSRTGSKVGHLLAFSTVFLPLR